MLNRVASRVSLRSRERKLWLFHELLRPGPETTVVYTRRAPEGVARPPGRLSAADLVPPPGGAEVAYVCGSAGFADTATDLLVSSGVPAAAIRVERFGPTGAVGA